MAKKTTQKPKLQTSKMTGESEQQYLAWLLYCEAGSIDKLLRQWQRLHDGQGEIAPEMQGFRDRLGKPAARRTVAQWSTKYQWVDRTEMKLQEDLDALRDKTKKIASERMHKVAEIFEKYAQQVLKQAKRGAPVTTTELKAIWEMFRTELGESIGKTEHSHTLHEDDQSPPTDEERELGAALDSAVKNFYDKRGTEGEN